MALPTPEVISRCQQIVDNIKWLQENSPDCVLYRESKGSRFPYDYCLSDCLNLSKNYIFSFKFSETSVVKVA